MTGLDGPVPDWVGWTIAAVLLVAWLVSVVLMVAAVI